MYASSLRSFANYGLHVLCFMKLYESIYFYTHASIKDFLVKLGTRNITNVPIIIYYLFYISFGFIYLLLYLTCLMVINKDRFYLKDYKIFYNLDSIVVKKFLLPHLSFVFSMKQAHNKISTR